MTSLPPFPPRPSHCCPSRDAGCQPQTQEQAPRRTTSGMERACACGFGGWTPIDYPEDGRLSAYTPSEYIAFLALLARHRAIAAAKRYQPIEVPPLGGQRQVPNHTDDLSKAVSADLVRYHGKVRRIGELADRAGLNRQTVLHRLRLGWTLHRALTTPSGTQGRGKAA